MAFAVSIVLLHGAIAEEAGATTRGALSLASVFSDHMVLQRDAEAPVWGKGAPGAKVRVEIAGQAAETTADGGGRWRVKVGPLPAGGDPLELRVTSGEQSVVMKDVLVGDVWLASGQSNMVMSVETAKDGEKEVAAARWPHIRLLNVPDTAADEPAESFEATSWQPVTPESVKSFSAVAYYFGRELHEHLDVPIGLIACDIGATGMETWTSREALESSATFRQRVADSFALPLIKENPEEYKRTQYYYPTRLFNGMISPVIPYGIRGVIWYQGESNSAAAGEYVELTKLMVGDWRKRWGQGEFPFLYVQLPGWAGGETWPEFREAQAECLQIPNTAMAVAIDVGERDDIHPHDKQSVGKRLALAARRLAYGETVVDRGPTFKSVTFEGGKARVSFEHVGGGLEADGEVRGFEIAGADGKFAPARAAIEGEQIVASSEAVAEPTVVRYDWAPFPEGNLSNAEGLPAGPFRTKK